MEALARNVGRIFGMGLLSFLVIGGAFGGLFFLVYSLLPNVFNTLATEMANLLQSGEGSDVPEF